MRRHNEDTKEVAGGKSKSTRRGNMAAHFFREESGQSTAEFVLVFCALLAMVVAFIAIFQAGTDGVFVRLGMEAASHTLGGSVLGMVQDVLLY